ncbi:MAG: hypothetical protein IJ408_07265 [Clostridia bacterium]|nr:hypothetical protein [Clostridia bacterium]
MLYKKNNTKVLEKELFEKPTAEYRAAPFWAWNAELTEGQLLKQIECFKQMGLGGFHMHSRTGLATPYLSDEFMEMVKTCCDKAESEGMLAWLYDEDRWSSGPAGGIVTKKKEFRRKRLELFPEDKGWNTPKEAALPEGVPYPLAVYDVVLDADGFLESFRRIEKSEPAKGTKWYAYCVNEKESPWFNYQTYFDAMDREAVAEFIKVTHERYKEVIGERFGKSVPAIFTDEPNANHEKYMFAPTPEYKDRQIFTWTRFFEEKYLERYGEDFLDVLPELVWNKKDGSDSLTKYRFFDFVAEEFSQNFSKQIGDWCEQNGIALTGHYLREPELFEQAITCGEIMRNYGYMGLPGVDILCSHHEFTTLKQAQSAVHQYGKEGLMSELYGVTNWDFDFRGHKMQGDWQAALGVTVRVPHLAWLSMKGEAKRDYPAAIGYQSPWYKEYSFIEDHFARVNTALTRGSAIVKIGVIHPIESYWISSGPVSQTTSRVRSLEDNFDNVTKWLLSNHLDFDFICESTLPDIRNGSRVGKMQYDAIVVPGCLTLRATTLDFLSEFSGKVIFMGGCPEYVDGVKSDGCRKVFEKSEQISFDSASLQTALEDTRCVRIINSRGENETRVLYSLRRDNDCKWLFIACCNEFGGWTHRKPQRDVANFDTLTITVDGELVPTEYDTLTGEIKSMSYRHKNGKTVIEYPFIVCDSILIKLTENAEETDADEKERTLVSSYELKKTVDFELSEQNVLLLDMAEYRYDDGEWQETEEILRISRAFRESLNFKSDQTQPYAVEISPAEHKVSLRFDIKSEIEVAGASLALEDAELAKITFNGERVENKISGYFTDESINTVPLPVIKAGQNTLELEFPYGERTNIEWCYILGNFGVSVLGCEKIITKLPEKIGFGSVTGQSMPFYGANIDYSFDVTLDTDGEIEIEASYYRGSLIAVTVDGERRGRIVLPPYRLRIGDLAKGTHKVTLTLFGNRNNSFGALHLVNEGECWFGPDAWRTEGNDWSYEYRLKPLGILKSPIIRIYK